MYILTLLFILYPIVAIGYILKIFIANEKISKWLYYLSALLIGTCNYIYCTLCYYLLYFPDHSKLDVQEMVFVSFVVMNLVLIMIYTALKIKENSISGFSVKNDGMIGVVFYILLILSFLFPIYFFHQTNSK